MSLGSAILRPQGLDAPPKHGPSRAFDLVTEFFESLIADPQGLGATLEALASSGGGHLQTFLVSRQDKIRRAEGKLRLIFKPFIDVITGFLAGMGGGIPETLPGALKALRGVVAMVRKDSVIHMLRELIRLGRTDLDFNAAAVETLFRQCMEGAVADLQSRVNGGDLSEDALKRYEWGLNLRNLEHLILEELDWPALDVEQLLTAVGNLYDRKGIEGLLSKIQKVLDAAENLAEPLGLLLQTMLEKKLAVGGSVGAAADGDPPAPESASTNTAPISHYATWILRKESRCVIDETTTTIATIPAVTYNCITPKGMEGLAFHSLWITDLTESILHIISIEQRDIASNMMNAFWDVFNTVNTPVNEAVIPSWMHWAFLTGFTFFGGLETVRCSGIKDACFPMIQILGDGGETVLYRRWTWLAREFVLSTVTMANFDDAKYEEWKEEYSAAFQTKLEEIETIKATLKREKGALEAAEKDRLENRLAELEDAADMVEYRFTIRQANHNQFHGVVYGLGELGALVLPAVLSDNDRLNYGFQDGFMTWAMVGKMFGGLAIALGFRGAGLLAGAGIARRFPDDTKGALYTWLLLANERMLWNPKEGHNVGRWFWIVTNLFIEWVMQAIYLYLFTNGNTDGGTFLAYEGTSGKFAGYPPASSSPYLLPWNAGEKIECAQNNMGIWSHYPDGGQAYAYDFSHDGGTEVLASRGGIVTTLTQTQINHNTDDWNTIEVLSLQLVDKGGPGAMPAVPAPKGITKYTDGGTTENKRVPTPIEADTKFPPYWDVYGNPWPVLPRTMPLLPSGAVLPAGTALGAGLPADKDFTFLAPEHDKGIVGVTYPKGSKFSDGSTPIPDDVVFAPDAESPPTTVTPMYMPGTTFSPIRRNFTSQPFDPAPKVPPATLPGFAPAAGATFMDGSKIPAGLVLPPDCGITQPWLPLPHQSTPMYLPTVKFFAIDPLLAMPVTGTATAIGSLPNFFMAGTNYLPLGTKFPDIPTAVPTDQPLPPGTMPALNHEWMIPVGFIFTQYGHAISGFSSVKNFTYAPPTAKPTKPAIIRDLAPGETAVTMPGQPDGVLIDIFGTPDNSQIEGQFVKQGRGIMLSGDTGVSAYNHLHTHVLLDSSVNYSPRKPYQYQKDDGTFDGPEGMIFTVPFVYQDVTHGLQHGFREGPQRDGVPHAMTWYESKNKKPA